MRPDDIVHLLGMQPLIPEGGFVSVQLADDAQSAIYYLLVAPDFSALHRLAGPEVWHFYGGAPVRMTVVGPDGTPRTHVLGMDLATGERPQFTVPAGFWQGSITTGEWSLVGTTMTPPYDHRTTEFATEDLVRLRWPAHVDTLISLTRGSS